MQKKTEQQFGLLIRISDVAFANRERPSPSSKINDKSFVIKSLEIGKVEFLFIYFLTLIQNVIFGLRKIEVCSYYQHWSR